MELRPYAYTGFECQWQWWSFHLQLHWHSTGILQPPITWEEPCIRCSNPSSLIVPFPRHHLHWRIFLCKITGSTWSLGYFSLHTSSICRQFRQCCYFIVWIDPSMPIVQPTSALAIIDPVSFHTSPCIFQGPWRTSHIFTIVRCWSGRQICTRYWRNILRIRIGIEKFSDQEVRGFRHFWVCMVGDYWKEVSHHLIPILLRLPSGSSFEQLSR